MKIQNYHLQITPHLQNRISYLEKNDIQDYLSGFFAYDKRKQKKAAFFYYKLLSTKKKEEEKKRKFLFDRGLNNFSIRCTLKNNNSKKQNYLISLLSRDLQSCKMYSQTFTSNYTSCVSLGITAYKDPMKAKFSTKEVKA